MRKRYSADQIVRVLGAAAGQDVSVTMYKFGVSEQALCVWRRRVEGMGASQVVELKRLQQENARRKKVIVERGC